MQYISNFFNLLNNIFLKMTWLSDGTSWIVENIFRLPINDNNIWGKIGGSLQFFIYDSIKIMVLLSVLIFIFSYIESKFTPEKTKTILVKLKGVRGAIIGALMGTITPFCSCSSIPIFISFVKAGLPMEVTFSFLISSPFVDLASTVILASIFGWKMAIAYVIIGVLLAIIGGMLIGKMNLEKYIQDYIFNMKVGKVEEKELTKKERIEYAKEQVKTIYKKVWKYILLGVGIGAVIHNWIPQSFVETVLGNNIFSPILAALIGIPMYADIFGTIPIAEALVFKGVGVGTVLTFMMGVTALSIPSIIMLKQAMKPRLLGIFVGIITVGIILIGYIFNIFGYLLV